MVTARNVYAPGESTGIPLLAADVCITEGIRAKLVRSGVDAILIDDQFSAGIEARPPISPETRQQAITVLSSAFSTMAREGNAFSHAQLVEVEGVMSKIITEISSRRGLLMCLSDLNLFGGARMQHALNVCVIGVSVARQFFREHGWKDYRGQRREDGIEERIVKLGIGMLLQDIGMLAVPESIRDKHGMLTSEQRKIMQQHPLLGLQLLDSGELSPLTKVAIAQHHERFDGSGYPRGLAGDDLHDHGQIAAVAETYTALCSNQRPGERSFHPHDAYRLVLQARGKLFRADIVDAFAAAVAPYGSGATVQLSDGRYAVVVANRAGSPLKPRVRITHDRDGMIFNPFEEVDLHSAIGHVSIEAATAGLPGDRGIGPER